MMDVIFFRESFLKSHNKADYISTCITDSTKIDITQKRLTKKAILWLLSKGSHTIEEISDHFELSPELVTCIIEELARANLVIKEHGRFPRYQLNPEENITKLRFLL